MISAGAVAAVAAVSAAVVDVSAAVAAVAVAHKCNKRWGVRHRSRHQNATAKQRMEYGAWGRDAAAAEEQNVSPITAVLLQARPCRYEWSCKV